MTDQRSVYREGGGGLRVYFAARSVLLQLCLLWPLTQSEGCVSFWVMIIEAHNYDFTHEGKNRNPSAFDERSGSSPCNSFSSIHLINIIQRPNPHTLQELISVLSPNTFPKEFILFYPGFDPVNCSTIMAIRRTCTMHRAQGVHTEWRQPYFEPFVQVAWLLMCTAVQYETYKEPCKANLKTT